jgi:hypothetical protein
MEFLYRDFFFLLSPVESDSGVNSVVLRNLGEMYFYLEKIFLKYIVVLKTGLVIVHKGSLWTVHKLQPISALHSSLLPYTILFLHTPPISEGKFLTHPPSNSRAPQISRAPPKCRAPPNFFIFFGSFLPKFLAKTLLLLEWFPGVVLQNH